MSLGDEAYLCSGINNDKDSPPTTLTKRLGPSDHDNGPWATGSAAGRKPLPAGRSPVYIDAKTLYLIDILLTICAP